MFKVSKVHSINRNGVRAIISIKFDILNYVLLRVILFYRMSSIKQEVAAILMDYTDHMTEDAYMAILNELSKIPDHRDPKTAVELQKELDTATKQLYSVEEQEELLRDELARAENYINYTNRAIVSIMSNPPVYEDDEVVLFNKCPNMDSVDIATDMRDIMRQLPWHERHVTTDSVYDATRDGVARNDGVGDQEYGTTVWSYTTPYGDDALVVRSRDAEVGWLVIPATDETTRDNSPVIERWKIACWDCIWAMGQEPDESELIADSIGTLDDVTICYYNGTIDGTFAEKSVGDYELATSDIDDENNILGWDIESMIYNMKDYNYSINNYFGYILLTESNDFYKSHFPVTPNSIAREKRYENSRNMITLRHQQPSRPNRVRRRLIML